MMRHTEEFTVGQVATAKRPGSESPRLEALIVRIQKNAILAIVEGVEVRFGLQRSGTLRDPISGAFLL